MNTFFRRLSLPFGLVALAGCSVAAASDEEGGSAARSVAPAAPAAAGTAQGSSEEQWRRAMSTTPLPKEGCFKASQPSTEWVEIPCAAPPNVPYLPRKAHGSPAVRTVEDFTASVSGTISWAEGSFPRVTGVTSVTDSGNANNYSLQLNSNFFKGASLCSGAEVPCELPGMATVRLRARLGLHAVLAARLQQHLSDGLADHLAGAWRLLHQQRGCAAAPPADLEPSKPHAYRDGGEQ